MQKMALDSLMVEITRRCNMTPTCPHCFRGFPQNIDLNHEAMDNFLDQVCAISKLVITGGEPFANLDGVKYFFDGIVRRGIQLDYVEISTNGLIADANPKEIETFTRLLCTMDDYYLNTHNDGLQSRNGISVFGSVDKYHKNDCCHRFDMLMDEIVKEHPRIKYCHSMMGSIPERRGLATTLNEAISQEEIPDPHIINCVVSETHMTENPEYSDQTTMRVLNRLYLNAKGHIYGKHGNRSYEEQESQERIADMNLGESILLGIERYNIGKPKESHKIRDITPEEALAYSMIRTLQVKMGIAKSPSLNYKLLVRNMMMGRYATMYDTITALQEQHPELSTEELFILYYVDCSSDCRPGVITEEDRQKALEFRNKAIEHKNRPGCIVEFFDFLFDAKERARNGKQAQLGVFRKKAYEKFGKLNME